MAVEYEEEPCANPRCVSHGCVPKGDLHETGFCGACCPVYGSMGCSRCWDQGDEPDHYI